jgi:methionyl aminopeptidase
MSIETPEELDHLKAAGRVVAAAIRAMRRHVRPGIKLDVTAELDGFYADACISVPVGDAPRSVVKLAAASRVALSRALATAHAGVPINHVGRAVHASVESAGYSVCADLMGHSIGRRIHEPPNIPNYDAPGFDQALTDGLVITIEPIIAAGRGTVREAGDGWTITTRDGSYAAHAEHTIVITAGAPLVLTA